MGQGPTRNIRLRDMMGERESARKIPLMTVRAAILETFDYDEIRIAVYDHFEIKLAKIIYEAVDLLPASLPPLTARLHSTRLFLNRLAQIRFPMIASINALCTVVFRHYATRILTFANMLGTDSALRSFAEGKSRTIPYYYHHRFDAALGRYANLILPRERTG